MNTKPTDTRDAHLDLEDLIAAASGELPDEAVRRHLSSCAPCRLEVKRWHLVADGVRSLGAGAPEASGLKGALAIGGRVRSPRRRALLMVASAAAALLLLVGLGEVAGVVHVRFGSGSAPVLTAVSGCAGLEQADGTLTQVNGANLVIESAGGRPVTVTTTASSFISMSGPLLPAITDGSSVRVRGDSAGGVIRATIVTVGQPFSAVNPPGLSPVQGTVANASASGFTLVTSAGTRLAVITSASTLVVLPDVTPSQLQTGTAAFALGYPQPDGSLSARAVTAVSQAPSGLQVRVSVKNCAPSSIVEALGALSGTRASAG